MKEGALALLCVMAAGWFGLADAGQIALVLPILGLLTLAFLWERNRQYHWIFVWPMIVIALSFALSAYQYVAVADPASVPLGETQLSLLDGHGAFAVAADRDTFLDKAGILFLTALAYVGGLSLGGNYERSLKYLKLLVLLSGAVALLTLLLYAIRPDLLLWETRTSYKGYFTLTFVNRNTAATYLGAVSIVAMALIARRLQDTRLRQIVFWGAFGGVGRRLPVLVKPLGYVVCLGLFLAGLFATGSRGGIAASLLGMSAFVGIYVLKQRRWLLGAALAVMGVGVVLVLAQQNETLLASRFEDARSIRNIDRFNIYRSTLEMIEEHANLGVGLGGFASTFPNYRSDRMTPNTIIDRAHSTPLEIAAESGIWVAAAAGMLWLSIGGGLVWGIVRRRRRYLLPAMGLALWFQTSMHMLFDFSMQIGGFALMFFVVLGVAYAQAFARGGKREVEV